MAWARRLPQWETAILDALAVGLRTAALMAALLGLGGCGSDDPAGKTSGLRTGGLEAIVLDGETHYFAYDFENDEILSPLLPGKQAAAAFAAVNLRQREGARDVDFWLAHADESVRHPALTDTAGLDVPLVAIQSAIEDLRKDPETPRTFPVLAPEGYLWYLLGTNEAWEEQSPPASVMDAAKRFDLGAEDRGTWLYQSGLVLSGEESAPPGAGFGDAAVLFLWALDQQCRRQRHGWAEQLGLMPPTSMDAGPPGH